MAAGLLLLPPPLSVDISPQGCELWGDMLFLFYFPFISSAHAALSCQERGHPQSLLISLVGRAPIRDIYTNLCVS